MRRLKFMLLIYRREALDFKRQGGPAMALRRLSTGAMSAAGGRQLYFSVRWTVARPALFRG